MDACQFVEAGSPGPPGVLDVLGELDPVDDGGRRGGSRNCCAERDHAADGPQLARPRPDRPRPASPNVDRRGSRVGHRQKRIHEPETEPAVAKQANELLRAQFDREDGGTSAEHSKIPNTPLA